MRLPIFVAVFSIASSFVTAWVAEDASSEEIVLADPVRAAYYEIAPRRLAASMRRAVEDSCAVRGAARSETDAHRWLCNGTELAFLREVNVLGRRLKIGFVCSRKWASGVRYVDDQVADAIEEAKCVTVWFNSLANVHFLDFGEADE